MVNAMADPIRLDSLLSSNTYCECDQYHKGSKYSVMLQLVTANGSRNDGNNLIIQGGKQISSIRSSKKRDIKNRLFVALIQKSCCCFDERSGAIWIFFCNLNLRHC